MRKKLIFLTILVLLTTVLISGCVSTTSMNIASANLVRGINIDFVNIGHAGNAADTPVQHYGNTVVR